MNLLLYFLVLSNLLPGFCQMHFSVLANSLSKAGPGYVQPTSWLCLFFRYFCDGKELVAQIHEKQKELPDDVGEDFSKAESFHRMHAAFERDITTLGKQVTPRNHTTAPWRRQCH